MVRIFKDKKTIGIFVVIVILGMVLMLGENGIKVKNTAETATDSTEDYELEKRLSAILSKVKGAGNVNVMITYQTGKEKVIAYNTNNEKDNSAFSSRESAEAVINGDSPVILKELYPEVEGVLIVAQGGGNTEVKNNLIRASQALLGIDVNKIEVLVMKKED